MGTAEMPQEFLLLRASTVTIISVRGPQLLNEGQDNDFFPLHKILVLFIPRTHGVTHR